MGSRKKTVAAAAGAVVLAGLPSALAFGQSFNPSGGSGGSGGSTGYEQGYSQGYDQGESAGYISTGPALGGGTLTVLTRTNVNQRTGSKVNVKAHNSNKAGNANGGKGGNAFNRF